MKRFLLSGAVIGSFVLFSLYYRFLGQLPIINQTGSPSSPVPTSPSSVPSQSSPPPLTPSQSLTSVPNTAPSAAFKDGSYTGDVIDALYGNIQVQTVIQGGKIADIQFLQYPNDRTHSIRINQDAMPILKSEAIQAQSAQVDVVSGATDSSQAFVQSLQSTLIKAKNSL